MRYKALKHLTQDLYGHMVDTEFYFCTIPQLQPETATMELMQAYFLKECPEIYDQLIDLRMVTIEANEIEDETPLVHPER